MKKLIALTAAVLLAVAGWAAYQVAARASERSFAALMPSDAVLFVETPDLSAVLRRWNQSPEKAAWLVSDDHASFSQSRLYLRLEEAQKEFAEAAGVPPDSAFLNDVAGERSALALYDIGKLEMLFVTRLSSSHFSGSGLWQQRGHFETRESAGRKFYVRTDPKSERVVAFASEDGYLILGTREDLVAGALALLAGKKETSLEQAGWFADALKSNERKPGDFRMAIHLSEVTKTPHFRTYWIQRNITEMRRYDWSLSDLYLGDTNYHEERTLHLLNASATPDDAAAVAELARLVPAETGFHRATASPSPEESLRLVEQSVLLPKSVAAAETRYAPPVAQAAPEAGDSASLDVRIDEPPSQVAAQRSGDELLRALLQSAHVRAQLQLHRSEAAADGVFVRLYSTVVLAAPVDWDEAAVQKAVQAAIAPGMTTSNLGAQWRSAGATQKYSELDGLSQVAVAVRGKLLFLSNDPATLAAALAHVTDATTAQPAVYRAGFDHARERANYYRLTQVIDQPSRRDGRGADAQPEFYSQDVASLSRSLARVKSQSVVVTRKEQLESQTVNYEWAK